MTETGTVSPALLPSVTLVPPRGAAWLTVTVQVLTALGPRLLGMQATLETSGVTIPTAAVRELAPSVAVTVTL